MNINQHTDRYKQLESHQVKEDFDLIRSLTEAEEKVRKLTDDLSASQENQKQVEYLRREVNELNNRNLGLENSNQKLILEIDKNDKIIRKLENEKDDLCAELVTLSDVASKFTEFEKCSESTNFENESKIQQIREQNCKLGKELKEALQKNETDLKEFATSEINMIKSQFIFLTLVKVLIQKFDFIRSDLSDVNDKLDHFKSENEELKLELKSAETMTAELLNQQENLEKDATKSRLNIENLQALNEKKIEEIQVFKEDIDKYSRLYNKNKNNIKELRALNDNLQAQIADQSAQNKVLSDQLHTAQANLKGIVQ